MRIHTLERSVTVAAPRPEVFAFFARPENLARLTPDGLGFRILTPGPIAMQPGALIDYVVRVGGVAWRWTTLIAAYEPPRRFVDVQLRGPYSFWHHEHTFAEADGGTVIGDRVRYALPLGPLGELVHALAVRRRLRGIFDHRGRAIGELFGDRAEGPAREER